jgi:hypothetical protein
MKTSIAVGTMAIGLALAARPAQAQIVEAGVVIRSGPVYGHVVVGPPYTPRVIVVEPVHYGWWRNQHRPIVVYYDGVHYYDRWFSGRPGLRRVEAYQRGGRYYRWDGRDRDRERYDDRGGHDWDD